MPSVAGVSLLRAMGYFKPDFPPAPARYLYDDWASTAPLRARLCLGLAGVARGRLLSLSCPGSPSTLPCAENDIL